MKKKQIYESKIVHHEAKEAYDEEVKYVVGHKYIADDGKEFEDEQQCAKYEREIRAREADKIIIVNRVKEIKLNYGDILYYAILRLDEPTLDRLCKLLRQVTSFCRYGINVDKNNLYLLGYDEDSRILEDYTSVYSEIKSNLESMTVENLPIEGEAKNGDN